ncbi:sigma-70 family RNA polymerase sigma factor [Paenibacillus azoreducens]|nr:sigma-70 family RNA polymerase sigma factor [Paenibacillus azoreducens]
MEMEVKKAQQGDLDAFVRLMRNLESQLYGLAKSILRHDEDCADAMQETMLKAYKSLTSLRKPEFFKTWMIRILINECNQLLRNRKRTVVMNELPEASNPATSYYGDYQKIDLEEAVNSLDETLRIVIHLFYYQDLPIKQISEVLNISKGAVKGRLHRARGILADWMKNRKEEDVSYEPI